MFPQNVLHKYTARTYVYYDVIIPNDDIVAYIVVGNRPTTSQPSPGYLADTLPIECTNLKSCIMSRYGIPCTTEEMPSCHTV